MFGLITVLTCHILDDGGPRMIVSYVILYADDILLLATTVIALENLVRACKHEVI